MTTWDQQLRKYQRDAALRMAEPPQRGQLLAFPPGYGKTPTALGAFRYRLDKKLADHQTMVVVTTALAKADWRRIVAWFWPELKFYALGEESSKRNYQRVGESDEDYAARRDGRNEPWRKMLLEPTAPGVLVTSFDSAHKVIDFCVEKDVLLDTVTVDEAQYIKYSGTQRSANVRPLIAKANVCALMTGTPVDNRPHDLHALLQSCDPSIPSKWRWAEKYFCIRTSEGGFGQTIDELQEGGKERLVEDYGRLIISADVKSAFGELPAVIRELKLVSVPGAERVRLRPGVARRLLRDESAAGETLRKCVQYKLDAAVELLDIARVPAVAYTWRREDAEKLCAKLNKAKVSAMFVHGDLSPDKRAKAIDEWKAGSHLVLCATMASVRESATLTRADLMLFVDFALKPGEMIQLEGRIHPSRQPEGERRPARYWYLCVENGPDELLAELLVEKIREAQGIGGQNDEAAGLGSLLTPPSEKQLNKLTPDMLLSQLVERCEARAARLEELGLVLGE